MAMAHLLAQARADRAREEAPAAPHPAIVKLRAEQDAFDRLAENEDAYANRRPAIGVGAPDVDGPDTVPPPTPKPPKPPKPRPPRRRYFRRNRSRGRGGNLARELIGGLAGPGSIGGAQMLPGTTTAAGSPTTSGPSPIVIILILSVVGVSGYLLYHKLRMAKHQETQLDKGETPKGEG